MQTPLNASATSAGALFSNSTFEVPQFQREYSWQEEEVKEFFDDLQANLDGDSYFLGLVILTKEGQISQVVDGQQRIVTLTLLASALHQEAKARGRAALADRIQADFLRSIVYETDETKPRVVLADQVDNATLQDILDNGINTKSKPDNNGVSAQILSSYAYISKALSSDLKSDPFRRMGKWTEFITDKLYFAVFVHPDPATAYQVYEVINTRGRDLTTADLLKNFVLSQTPKLQRPEIYSRWKYLSAAFPSESSGSLVQYIRHVVTVTSGHILPRDLFSFLAGRIKSVSKQPPTPPELMSLLGQHLPLYSQMVDPTREGPADQESLRIFSALNALNVITVRPLMLAISDVPDHVGGLRFVLKLVVRRIIVGNLGTGNIERRFSDAARKVKEERNWRVIERDLADLDPDQSEFLEQLKKRSFNKGTLAFVRSSIVADAIAPETYYTMHFVLPKTAKSWVGFSDDERAYWGSTLGNTFLSRNEIRPDDTSTWSGFRAHMLPTAAPGEDVYSFESRAQWDATAVREIGQELARRAVDIWYGA